jgi:hypothetical protein
VVAHELGLAFVVPEHVVAQVDLADAAASNSCSVGYWKGWDILGRNVLADHLVRGLLGRDLDEVVTVNFMGLR